MPRKVPIQHLHDRISSQALGILVRSKDDSVERATWSMDLHIRELTEMLLDGFLDGIKNSSPILPELAHVPNFLFLLADRKFSGTHLGDIALLAEIFVPEVVAVLLELVQVRLGTDSHQELLSGDGHGVAGVSRFPVLINECHVGIRQGLKDGFRLQWAPCWQFTVCRETATRPGSTLGCPVQVCVASRPGKRVCSGLAFVVNFLCVLRGNW